MLNTCRQENCTFVETGACLLNNDPATCPHRDEIHESISSEIAGASIPPLMEPERYPQFPRSLPLTPSQVREVMGGRYFRLIGIVGVPNAGKTASLVSLYLLLSTGKLEGFSFANSRTLMAFEEISQGARRWNEGQFPEQLTAHTELEDERIAGFLHLRLIPTGRNETVDLLLPDLPGEWTTALIDNNRTDRFEFLKRADVVWLMVNGGQLLESTTRQFVLHRTRLLIQRLGELLEPASRVILVVTRRDQGKPSQKILDSLREEVRARGLNPEVVLIASFSDADTVAPGCGIAELIATTATPICKMPAFWPEYDNTPGDTRAMIRFGRR